MNNNRFKPFSTTLMGSMPRSKELLDLKEKSIKKKEQESRKREVTCRYTHCITHPLLAS